MAKARKVDIVWEELFNMYPILKQIQEKGFAEISAEQIKNYLGTEPRLVTKFDHYYQLPKIFQENLLSILPLTRGSYTIGHYLTHHTIENEMSNEENWKIESMHWNSLLESLNIHNVPSETIAVNIAEISGILSEFLGEDKLYATTAGRMGSGCFDFQIGINDNQNILQTIPVENSQIEIDAGYESMRSLTLIEAKKHLYEDFLIRQLYYPMRTWRMRIKKPVRTVFFMYSSGIYHLMEYEFPNPKIYSDIRLVNCRHFTLDDTNIQINDVISIIQNTVPEEEPKNIPFPQADKMWRILDMTEKLCDEPMNSVELADEYGFRVRQGNYYASACKYLGLVDSTPNNQFAVTEIGRRIASASTSQKHLLIACQLMKHAALHVVAQHAIQSIASPEGHALMRIPPLSAFIEAMHRTGISLGSEKMYQRRGQTIRSWMIWLFSNCTDLEIIE